MVRGTFSPARAWRPAVVARLARTLGIRKSAEQRSRRKCACRRASNNHNAAEPRITSRRRLPVRSDFSRGTHNEFGQHRHEQRPIANEKLATATAGNFCSAQLAIVAVANRIENSITNANDCRRRPEVRTQKPLWESAMQGAERHAAIPACAADAEFRDCSCRGAEREAESLARSIHSVDRRHALMPNPSFKRSANGRPPAPGRRYAVHFRHPGASVLPLSPA